MKDIIYRQDAIKKLESEKDKKAKGDIAVFYNKIIENDIEKLRKLPSAQPEQECEKCIFKPFKQFQPERKKGKWINEGVYGEGHAQCSIRCNNPLCNFHYIGYLGDYNFCPNCGADMREVDDERPD